MKEKIIDITIPISEDALVYPGDPPLKLKTLTRIGPDIPYNITELGWTTHFLTHVDPPSHFIENGSSLDEIPIDRFLCPAEVIEIQGDCVLPSHIPSADSIKGKAVLFKTRNSLLEDWYKQDFDQNHVYITKEAASKLAENNANLVGIDYKCGPIWRSKLSSSQNLIRKRCSYS